MDGLNGLYEAEYLFLFEAFEGFNDQSLLIKGWSVTVGMAALLAAYLAKPSDRPGRGPVLVAAVSVLPFYLTDALWKAVQEGFGARLTQIETVMAEIAAGQEPWHPPLQAWRAWKDEFGAVTLEGYLEAAMNTTVLLPHVPIFLFGVVLALAFPPRAGTAAGQRPRTRQGLTR